LNPAASHDLPGVPIYASTLLLAQQLAGRSIDEMQIGASRTNYRLKGGSGRVTWLICQPMLYVQSRSGTFEYDMAAHAGQYDDAGWPSK
jgi:hypothetical protein